MWQPATHLLTLPFAFPPLPRSLFIFIFIQVFSLSLPSSPAFPSLSPCAHSHMVACKQDADDGVKCRWCQLNLLSLSPSLLLSVSLAVAGAGSTSSTCPCPCPCPTPLGGKLIHPLENKLQVAFFVCFSSLKRATAVNTGCVRSAGCRVSVCLPRIFINCKTT